MMDIIDILQVRKEHIDRFSSTNGSQGENLAIQKNKQWIERPKAKQLNNLLSLLSEGGINIKRTSFDAIELPEDVSIDFGCLDSIKANLSLMNFIEIKTTNKESVKEDFTGYFFAFTESELHAAEQLGERHKVALVNKRTDSIVMSSVTELLARAKSMNWQVSIQL
ncbi:hypothetical protein ACPV5A_17475 [Vibrio chagasii]|uniref:hypothetical protein n=1 Tax=Vibrio chagasii TaxID=170679 RepID=UPI004067F70A